MDIKKTHSKQESTPVAKTIRLNKFLSNAGICSRREADEFIKMGLVHVNGKTVTEMGYQVQTTDEIKYDGARVQQSPPCIYCSTSQRVLSRLLKGGRLTNPCRN